MTFLLHFFVPPKVPTRTSVIIKYTPKFFSASYVLFMTGLATEKITPFLEAQFKLCGLMGYYALPR